MFSGYYGRYLLQCPAFSLELLTIVSPFVTIPLSAFSPLNPTVLTRYPSHLSASVYNCTLTKQFACQ